MEQATSLILIAAAVFVLPLVAGNLRLPAVVLEIVFGVLAGPVVLDLIQGSEILDLFAELGLFLLMFLAGFEIDFRNRTGTYFVQDVVTLPQSLCQGGSSGSRVGRFGHCHGFFSTDGAEVDRWPPLGCLRL